jgi:hypothetical protein
LEIVVNFVSAERFALRGADFAGWVTVEHVFVGHVVIGALAFLAWKKFVKLEKL